MLLDNGRWPVRGEFSSEVATELIETECLRSHIREMPFGRAFFKPHQAIVRGLPPSGPCRLTLTPDFCRCRLFLLRASWEHDHVQQSAFCSRRPVLPVDCPTICRRPPQNPTV